MQIFARIDKGSRALVVANGLAVGLAVALLVALASRDGWARNRFLLWNLALAATPLVPAALFAWRERRWPAAGGPLTWLLLGGWLLWLPNAPYLLTDLIHLRPRPTAPAWLELSTLLAFAWAGIMLGYSSLLLVRGAVAARWPGRAGWVAPIACLLCGAGVAIGRRSRVNSWELISDPAATALACAEAVHEPAVAAFALAFAALLAVGAVGLAALAAAANSAR